MWFKIQYSTLILNKQTLPNVLGKHWVEYYHHRNLKLLSLSLL